MFEKYSEEVRQSLIIKLTMSMNFINLNKRGLCHIIRDGADRIDYKFDKTGLILDCLGFLNCNRYHQGFNDIGFEKFKIKPAYFRKQKLRSLINELRRVSSVR